MHPPETRSILFTNVNGSGDNVMVFTTLTAALLSAAYRNTTVTFDECCEVPEADVQYYLHEPCWLNLDEEARARKLAAA